MPEKAGGFGRGPGSAPGQQLFSTAIKKDTCKRGTPKQRLRALPWGGCDRLTPSFGSRSSARGVRVCPGHGDRATETWQPGTRARPEKHHKSWHRVSDVLLGALPNRARSSRRNPALFWQRSRKKEQARCRVLVQEESQRDGEQTRQRRAFTVSQDFFASPVRHD